MFLEISQNLHEKTCIRVSFLIKLQASGLRSATLLKKRLRYRCFPVKFAKFLRTAFFIETSSYLYLRRHIKQSTRASEVTTCHRENMFELYLRKKSDYFLDFTMHLANQTTLSFIRLKNALICLANVMKDTCWEETLM